MATEPSRKTPEEIATLAKDLAAGRIFTMHHLPPDQLDMLGMVFMPLGLGGIPPEMDRGKIGTLYEYLDKAGERGVNGFPSFFSVNLLHADDWREVLERAKKVEAAMNEAANGSAT